MVNRILTWAPAAGAVVVVAAAAIAIPMAANASSTLPTKTPAQVLELIAKSHVSAFSATVEQTSNLGFPSLPSTGPGSDSGIASSLALLSGTHSIRVFSDGPRRQRVQLLDSMAEKDLIRNGKDVWVYDSKANTAEHSTLTFPRKAHLGAMKQGQLPTAQLPTAQLPTAQLPAGSASTPAELATTLLAALQKSSDVTVGTDVVVANRTAYDLVLTPKVGDSLIGSVSIAVDPTTGIPLGVDVDARGQATPAFSVHFSQLTVAKPAASLFRFTPPANAKVTQVKPHKSGPAAHDSEVPKALKAKPTVTGTGWDAVVTIPKQSQLTKLESSAEFGLMTSRVEGGSLLHTSIVNILFTTDGRVVVGSVSAARLEAVAAAQ